jgi:hypothetical protein
MTKLDKLFCDPHSAAMTLKQAVKKLGGPSAAAQKSGSPRTSIIYWASVKNPPKWRQIEIDRIIELAKQQEAA